MAKTEADYLAENIAEDLKGRTFEVSPAGDFAEGVMYFLQDYDYKATPAEEAVPVVTVNGVALPAKTLRVVDPDYPERIYWVVVAVQEG